MRTFLGAAALAVFIGLSGAAVAHEVKDGDITISHPHAAPTPPGAKTGAAYMRIVNNGKSTLDIKGMSSPEADKVEIHTTTMDGDIVRMRQLEGPLQIAPGATLDLGGDKHIMLIGLKKPLVAEDEVELTIEFADGKTMDVGLYVEEHHTPGKSEPAGHEDHGDHH